MHRRLAARQGRSPAYPLTLQAEILKAHRVVAIHRALELQREDQVQIPPTARQKCASPLCRCPLKSLVELGDVVLPQKSIGGFHTRHLVQSEFLRQAALPSREVALAASPRLRRVGRNHLHPQLVRRPSHLGQTMRIHLAAHLRSQPEMAAAIVIFQPWDFDNLKLILWWFLISCV
jgi:hypothetical protein